MFVHDDRPDWKNLVKWLHLYRERLCSGLAHAGNENTHEKLLIGLFDVVKGSSDITAKDLDILLKFMRPVLADFHEDWADG